MAAEGGGGGGDIAGRVDALCSEIEDLVGQLRGVEDSWRQLTAPLAGWEQAVSESHPAVQPPLASATFSIRGDYGFEVGYQFPGSELSPEANQELAGRIQSAMDGAFDAARGSGAGCLDFSRYVLTQVIEPDAAALASSARALDEVALWLYDFTHDDVPGFVTELRASWPPSSLSSSGFYAFYEDLADVCTHYYGGAAALAGVAAGTSKIVEAYQDNLLELLEAGRDQVRKALQNWQAFKGPQQLVSIQRSGGSDSRASVLGATSLIAGIVGLFPPFGLAAGGVSVATGILSYSVGDKDVETRIDQVSSVIEIVPSINEGLQRLRSEMGDALDGIAAGGAGRPSLTTYTNDSLSNPNWVANEVDLS